MRDWHPRMDVSSLASVPMAKVAVLPYKNINIVIHSFIATAWHCWLLVVGGMLWWRTRHEQPCWLLLLLLLLLLLEE